MVITFENHLEIIYYIFKSKWEGMKASNNWFFKAF